MPLGYRLFFLLIGVVVAGSSPLFNAELALLPLLEEVGVIDEIGVRPSA